MPVIFIFVRFSRNWNFLDRFSKNEQLSCGETDRQTDMTKLTFAFRNFATNERVIYFNEPVISKLLK